MKYFIALCVASSISAGILAAYWNKLGVLGTTGMRLVGGALALVAFGFYWLMTDVVLTRRRSHSRKDP